MIGTQNAWPPTVRAPQRAGWVAGAKGNAAPRASVDRETLPGHIGLPASSAPATPGVPHSRTICWAPGKNGKHSPVGARRWKTLGGRGRARKGDAPGGLGRPHGPGHCPCGFDLGHPPVHLFGDLYGGIFRIFRKSRSVISYISSMTCAGVYFGYLVNLVSARLLAREEARVMPLGVWVIRTNWGCCPCGLDQATHPRRAPPMTQARTNWRALGKMTHALATGCDLKQISNRIFRISRKSRGSLGAKLA